MIFAGNLLVAQKVECIRRVVNEEDPRLGGLKAKESARAGRRPARIDQLGGHLLSIMVDLDQVAVASIRRDEVAIGSSRQSQRIIQSPSLGESASKSRAGGPNQRVRDRGDSIVHAVGYEQDIIVIVQS